MDDPWTQDQYDHDPEVLHDPFDGIYCVWISNFFTNATNLIYYIRGTRNVEMFCSGMAGMQAFNGAALFSITHTGLEAITKPIWPSGPRSERLVKSKSPIETNKWRYMYETGRMMWGKSSIDLDKLGQAMEMSSIGDSDGSKQHRASDDLKGPSEDQIKQQHDSATGRTERGQKMATLRGGAGRSDSVADMHVNERPKRQRRNIDYKRLHNG